jgi:hypothetical protein
MGKFKSGFVPYVPQRQEEGSTMAVQTQTRQRWTERKLPNIFKFESTGEVLEGLLVQIRKTQTQGKPTLEYVILQADGQTQKILGTWDINSKIFLHDVGCVVQITYVGENRKVKRGENFLRVFRVLVRPAIGGPAVSPASHHEITDEDTTF